MSISPSDIVKELSACEGGLLSAELADRFEVSERTVQRHILNANNELLDIGKIERSRESKKYRLVINDEDAFSAYLKGRSGIKLLPETPGERIEYILHKLCSCDEWITLDSLADELCVSRRTISNDLRGVEKRVSRFGLKVESRPYRGVRVLGADMDKKLCMASASLITDDVWAIVSDMLEEVYAAYRFDFRSDLELRFNLARHIAPLLVRLSFGVEVDNPLIEDIRHRFPLAWAMASDAVRILQQRNEVLVSVEETGYIALAFALAIERMAARPKKRVLIVSPSGIGSARLLEFKFKQEFGRYIDSITTCELSAIAEVDLGKMDCIFSTAPLKSDVPVEVHQINAFLDSKDIAGVLELLKAPKPAGIMPFFSPDLFWPHIKARNKSEVLAEMLERATRVKKLNRSFALSVCEREKIAPTAFGNYVAMPHPVRACTDEPFVAVGLLDNTVEWDGHQVRAVFLISFSDSVVEPDIFNAGMASLLTDQDAICRLLENRSFTELQAILLKC